MRSIEEVQRTVMVATREVQRLEAQRAQVQSKLAQAAKTGDAGVVAILQQRASILETQIHSARIRTVRLRIEALTLELGEIEQHAAEASQQAHAALEQYRKAKREWEKRDTERAFTLIDKQFTQLDLTSMRRELERLVAETEQAPTPTAHVPPARGGYSRSPRTIKKEIFR